MLPRLLSLLIVFSLLTFFTQFSSAFTHANIIAGPGPIGETYYSNVAGISSVVVPAALMMGVILLAIRRWSLPFGGLTLLLTINAAFMFILGSSYAGAACRAGRWCGRRYIARAAEAIGRPRARCGCLASPRCSASFCSTLLRC